MTPDRLWEMCAYYDHHLNALGVEVREFSKEEYDAKGPPLPTLLAHCRWMARRCLEVFKPEYERAVLAPVEYPLKTETVREQWLAAYEPFMKAMRWACYVQCALNVSGIFSCTDLRDQTRSGCYAAVVRRVFAVPLGVKSPAGPTPPVRRTDLVPAFPCCEGARRIERKAGDATTLQGGWCPEHGLSLCVDAVIETDTDRYVRLEKEHLGDPDKKTGIYSEDITRHKMVQLLPDQSEPPKSLRWSSANPPFGNIPELTDEQLDRARLDHPPRPTEDTCSDDGTPK